MHSPRAETGSIAIQAESLGKKYLIGHQVRREPYVSLSDVITRRMRRLANPLTVLARGAPLVDGDELEDFWALKDVSFTIKRGELVGVIGRNGAGKSTLLKILSRITEPTAGRVVMDGRVASLLEVGTGFHPELTGRENIYLNGSILGMRRSELRKKFEQIVDFAEVEKFIDTPVKRYSSGMYMRLAFAVAAHIDPEILLVDEVLAVGDARFQEKCLGKLDEVVHGGRTVIFVSHNTAALNRLCSRLILLNAGRVVADGPTRDVLDLYLNEVSAGGGEIRWPARRAAASPFHPLGLRVRNRSGEITDQLMSSEPFSVEFEYDLTSDIRDLRVGLYVTAPDGEVILTTFDRDAADNVVKWPSRAAGRYISRCAFPSNFFAGGRYVFGCNAGEVGVRGLFTEEHALKIEIDGSAAPGSHWPEKRNGWIRPYFDWQLEPVRL